MKVDISKFIEECPSFFGMKKEEINEFQMNAIKEYYSEQCKKNEKYNKYVKSLKRENIMDSDGIEQIYKIPLIPSRLFKYERICSINDEDVCMVGKSSGTQGSISRVYRDAYTMDNFAKGVYRQIAQLCNFTEAYCINLGPSKEEANNLWFAYAMGMIKDFFPGKNFVEDGKFKVEEVFKDINENKNQYEVIGVIGAPTMYLKLIEYANKNNIVLENCDNLFCFTAGGWKNQQGNAITQEELYSKLQNVFLNFKYENLRDVYNMAEMNTIICECQEHKKHIPPWIKVITINPKTMELAKDGDSGMIAFVDTSVSSYPAFILTDDIGRVSSIETCACGCCSETLVIERRVKMNDIRGCALKMDLAY